MRFRNGLLKIKLLVYTVLTVVRLAPGKISTLIAFMVILGVSRGLSRAIKVYIPYRTGIPIIRFSRITPSIYIGPQHNLHGLQKLKREGINACVNIRQHFDDAEYGLAPEYYCYPARSGAPFVEQLDVAVNFIEDMIKKGNKVYIHCKHGHHKCAAVAVACFLKQGYTIDKAINFVKSRYPNMYLYPDFMQDLERLELRYALVPMHSSGTSYREKSLAALELGVKLEV